MYKIQPHIILKKREREKKILVYYLKNYLTINYNNKSKKKQKKGKEIVYN